MDICPQCKQPLKSGERFCGNCGMTIPASPASGGSMFASPPMDTAPTHSVSASESASPKAFKTTIVDEPLTNRDLWTWLKKDERRQLFYIGDRPALTEERYMELLSQRLQRNNVPATIKRRKIRWDNSDVTSSTYYVKLNTTDANPLSCILQFAQVGRFSFVEQRTFIAPPYLPAAPDRKRPVPDDGMRVYAFGVAFLIGGIMIVRYSIAGWAMMLIGALIVAAGHFLSRMHKAAIAYNDGCDAQEALYEQTWNDWADKVLLHSFQESTNGGVSRIYQAVFECIRQVNAEQFKGLEATDERESTSLHELQSQIAQRKASYR